MVLTSIFIHLLVELMSKVRGTKPQKEAYFEILKDVRKLGQERVLQAMGRRNE